MTIFLCTISLVIGFIIGLVAMAYFGFEDEESTDLYGKGP